ncbi:MAG: hypothetical protein FWG99_12265 [Treponema sp.]|nr:hypothetical protein [Treponema sp.]
MKKILLLMIFSGAMLAFADTEMPRFIIPTAKSNGMGGHHVAYTDNVFSLLVNPAAMMRVNERSFFALSFSLFNPESTFELLSPLMNAAEGDVTHLGETADVLSRQKGKIAMGMEMREFPLSFSWVADGFGFGLWNRVFINMNIIGTHVEFKTYGDVLMPFGFALRILNTRMHDLDAGITLKPFTRALFHERVNITDMLDNNDITDDLSFPLVIGAGYDIGLLYRWDIGFSAGVTFNDIITRGNVVNDFIGGNDDGYYVPSSISWGVAYDTKLGRSRTNTSNRFLSELGFTLVFDWRDFANAFDRDNYLKRNPALDISAGFQLSVFDIFKIRIGMSDLLPAFGFGIDIGPIEFDLAYYGMEFGLEPGILSVAAVDMTFAIRPGAKKRDWPWTQRSLIGVFTGVEAVKD